MRTFFFLVRCDDRGGVLVCACGAGECIFCAGAGPGVLFWYWCVHAAGVYYECGTGKSRTRAHHHQVRAYWCWSVHFSFVISCVHIGAGVCIFFAVVVNEYIFFL